MRARVRALLAAAVAAALVLGASAAAYGAWSANRVLPAVTVQSGDFGLTPSLALSLTGMYPGEKRTGVLSLARTGNGRWVYTIGTPTTSRATVVVYPTAMCGGATLTLPWSQTTVQALTASPQHCVEVTASTTLAQSQTIGVSLPVTAESRPTN